METWKRQLYIDLLKGDADAFTKATAASGDAFNRNQRKTYRRQARESYKLDANDKLLYKDKVQAFVTLNLRPLREMNDDPIEGIDFQNEKVTKFVWRPVAT